MKPKRYVLALDLKDDPELIAEYLEIHKAVWPDILASIREAGITACDMFRAGTRMVMILEVDDTFSFERKNAIDEGSAIVQKWEAFMWTFQQAIPSAKPGEKWVLMDQFFSL
ncbi:L-rhamnose mutarotase [Chitinophaga sp. GCM10012297]|uniref:L-rhamnose mutarotase n=1 Tax=Chitinophaga chungangae TaxID=2821488 RepID=A0ABS3YKZ6_9BACT|nr:L-rhamnose mutarotase [Chitinophaga chungangae]MBO9155372.1 L-rhamnose mutarotase [Chitinophaga chungangae]